MQTLHVRWSFFLLFLAAFAGVSLHGNLEGKAQQTTSQTRAAVGIRVGPVAQIDFPQGTGFLLDIPSRVEGLAGRGPVASVHAPHVDAATIPFTVTGNAWVMVSVEPAAVLASPPGSPVGRAFPDGPVGRALPDDPSGPNQGVELPYRLWIEFPSANAARSPAGLGNPSGGNPAQHSMSRANVADGPVAGIVHVVPSVTWGEIASRRFASPGLYRGEVQVTVTATEN